MAAAMLTMPESAHRRFRFYCGLSPNMELVLLAPDQPAQPDALCSAHAPLHVPRWRFLHRADPAGKARRD
jgi:hypothetical protein